MTEYMEYNQYQHLVILIVAAGFFFTGLVLWIRLHRIKVRVQDVSDSPPVPTEVREASHDLSRQSMKLRGGLRRLARSQKPIEALINAISGENNGNGHQHK